MPLYEYACQCGWKGDRRVAWSQRDRQTCEECGDWMFRQPHYGTLAVHIPVHMRATGDDIARRVMPQEPGERKRWLGAARDQGLMGGRYHHDLE